MKQYYQSEAVKKILEGIHFLKLAREKETNNEIQKKLYFWEEFLMISVNELD